MTLVKMSKYWLKTDVNGELVVWHVNLLNKKMTTDDDDDDDVLWLLSSSLAFVVHCAASLAVLSSLLSGQWPSFVL